jgi:hypothetical protein
MPLNIYSAFQLFMISGTRKLFLQTITSHELGKV